MDIDDWQASRIRNVRYRQDTDVKPWPWSIQVQILGSEGSGRHSLLDRICRGQFAADDDPFKDRDNGCKQTAVQGLACNVWFEIPSSLTAYGRGYALTKQELFLWLTRGMRDCDALILVYDLTDSKSFQTLCKFCARCEIERVGVAPGISLPCLIVGTKADQPNQMHLKDGQRLAERLGGRFMTCSSLTGRGFEDLVDVAIDPVVNARTRLMHESEDVLGQAIRSLLAWAGGKRMGLRKRLSKKRKRTHDDDDDGPPATRVKCTGAPPRWTMRKLINLPLCKSHQRDTGFESEGSDISIQSPCPPEYQLSVDIVEPATTDWAPRF